MGNRKRLCLLVLIMAGVALVVGATALGAFYGASLDRERQRLSSFAESEARLIAVLGPSEDPGLLEDLRRLRERATGRTAELQLARREGETIVFVTAARDVDHPRAPVAFGGPLAEAMTRALSGQSGTMIGRDDAGRRVLAAYEPLPGLGLGVVAKIDMAEIEERYIRAGLIAGLVSVGVVIGATLLFFRLGEPMIRRLRESEERYRVLVEAQPDPICQFLPDTTLVFVNRAYAEFYGRDRRDLIGKRWLDFATADVRPRFLEELSSFTPEQPERHEETRSTRADHEVRWYLCHLYGFFDRAGRIVSFQTFGTDITARKRAEEELARQAALLGAITDSAADAVFVSDDQERITLVNPAAERSFGWSRAELIGRKLHDTIHHSRPEGGDYPASDCPLSRVYRTGETLAAHEDVFFRKDGSPIAVSCSNAPLVLGGRIAGAVLVARDSSERKAGEQALRASEARLRKFVEAAPVAIAMFDREMRYIAASGRFCSDYRLDPEAIVGRSHYDVFPNLPERWRESHRRCLAGAVERSDAERFDREGGGAEWIRWEIQPWRAADGDIGGIVLFSEDISGRMRAEDALRESEARYRAAGEAIRYGVWTCDASGGVEFVSRSFLDLIGKTLDEVRPRGWLDRLPPEHLRPTLDAWRACVRSGRDWAWEHRVRGVDGVYRTILSLGRPVHDEQGRVGSWVGFNLDISERTRAEDALRASEARLRGTFENAAVGISNVGMDGTWLRVNQRLCEIVGYSREELLRKNFQELTHPEDLTTTLERFQALLRGEIDSYRLEKRYLRKDGKAVWVNLTSRLQRDDTGCPAYCITVVEDIGARKHAELALRESEARMRAILDASEDEILLLSTGGEVLAINKAAERRLARRAGSADLVGARLDRLLPPEQVERRMEIVRKVAESSALSHWDAQIRGRWFEFWFYPVFAADASVSEVAVYAREVTQRKKSEADLSKLFQAVQQSPVSVVITDRDGHIEYVNPEFTEVTGYTPAEAVGRNPRILKSGRTPPEVYADLWATIAAGGIWRGEIQNKKKSGELYWELASIAPVKDGGDITNYIAVKEDITKRREIEEQLRQSQKMQAVGQLTGGIAHDFNNLLGIIIGNLQLLSEHVGSDDKELNDYLDDALWSAKRGAELTHRLLAFARKQPLKPAVIDVNDVVRGMAELLRRTLGARIRIDETLAPDLWKAIADRGELERAVVNLAVNARDAMQGAGTVAIETRNVSLDEVYAEQHEDVGPGAYVLLSVTDTGVGMPPEVVQRVFEPFFTTKDVGKGSGLGLSMVYGFVKQSGGHVGVYSRVGLGTSVRLYLPRVPSAPDGLTDDPREIPVGGFVGRLVLVVEDEPRLRKVAVAMLERMGLRTVQAENAREALTLFANFRPDLVFTDVELPGGTSGTDLVDELRARDPSVKVLFTTGYAREGVLHEKWLQDGVHWLPKPYSRLDLARELKALLAPEGD